MQHHSVSDLDTIAYLLFFDINNAYLTITYMQNHSAIFSSSGLGYLVVWFKAAYTPHTLPYGKKFLYRGKMVDCANKLSKDNTVCKIKPVYCFKPFYTI